MQRLIELIKDQFEDQVLINGNTIPADVDGFDSLTAFSIIDAIEDEYGVLIDEKQLELSVKEINDLLND